MNSAIEFGLKIFISHGLQTIVYRFAYLQFSKVSICLHQGDAEMIWQCIVRSAGSKMPWLSARRMW